MLTENDAVVGCKFVETPGVCEGDSGLWYYFADRPAKNFEADVFKIDV